MRKLGKTVLGLGALALAAGCAASPPPSQQGQRPPVTVQSPPQQQAPQQPSRPAADLSLRVAMLVPMSGKYASIGQGLVEAAQLALFEAGTDDVAIITLDTAGDPMAAQKRAYEAITDGASLLVGPVFSPELEAVRPVAAARHVPILALSNNSLLADGNSFILGYTPAEQISRILSYARARGVTRVASLVPRSAYGDAVMESMMTSIVANGMTLVQNERFEETTDSTVVAQGFVSAVNARGGAEAILLPVSAQTFRSLVPQLVAAGMDVSRMNLLGTANWSSLDLQRMPVLGGVWFANLDPSQRSAFEQRYAQAYGHEPVSIASLAYDATALAIALTRDSSAQTGQHNDIRADLTNPKGFAGVDGIFRLRPQGLVERGLAVYETTLNGSRIIDPAPRSFAPAVQ